MQKSQKGKVIIPAGANPWPHEERVAKILARNGHKVEFIPEGQLKTADILLDGVEFEIKSPISNNPRAIERNLVRGLHQSRNIVFDSSRMKRARDVQTEKMLIARLKRGKGLKKIIFVNKKQRVIDINQLI